MSGSRFEGFAPYVPSISDAGAVCFQASFAEGGSGIVLWDGIGCSVVAVPGVSDAISHPDVNDGGDVSFYGTLTDGCRGVVRVSDDGVSVLADTRTSFRDIGPAGPTMNESGGVAFRAVDADGHSGMYVADQEGVHVIATAGDDWGEFHGLPVVTNTGAVVFRATRVSGTDGIYLARAGAIEPVVETGDLYASLGYFPSVSDDESVAFAAALQSGGGGIFRADPRGPTTTVISHDGFESYRGAVISGNGDVVVGLATPRGRSLGLFRGTDPDEDCLLAIGERLLDSTVIDLAANPVSMNSAGRIGVRASLADGRQVIVVSSQPA